MSYDIVRDWAPTYLDQGLSKLTWMKGVLFVPPKSGDSIDHIFFP